MYPKNQISGNLVFFPTAQVNVRLTNCHGSTVEVVYCRTQRDMLGMGIWNFGRFQYL
jgi:hypothetical protein